MRASFKQQRPEQTTMMREINNNRSKQQQCQDQRTPTRAKDNNISKGQ